MSRSNQTEKLSNPSTKWFDWDSDNGTIKYYDKEAKQSVKLKLPFTFLVLDQTATITGYHEQTESGMYSNEVRSTKTDQFAVKSFKGGVIALGLYQDIKDQVKSQGGKFTSNVYIAYKDGKDYALGCIQFKGASLQSWSDFSKNHRGSIMSKAISISSFDKGKKGKVEYTTPTFTIKDVTDEANEKAIELDKVLQEFFAQSLTAKPQAEPTAETTTTSHVEVKPTKHESPFAEDTMEESDDLPF